MLWFGDIAKELKQRLDVRDFIGIEFVAGVRVNGVPHIGTYMTLASTFLFAQQAVKHFNLPCRIRIHFLDNDPVDPTAGVQQRATHFHCVFQNRTPDESAQFINVNYISILDKLSVLTGCPYDWEVYSKAQEQLELRSAVLQSLRQWKNFKYFVSGPPLVGRPTGVRGIGFPCPECGLFNGWVRPSIEFLNGDEGVLKTECCKHGEYLVVLGKFNKTFVNLETTYRNVIKEIIAIKKTEWLSVMIKGVDWQEGLRNLNSVLEILGIEKDVIPLRFLVPVIKTANGIKLSKSAIQKSPNDFGNLPHALLDMNVLRTEIEDYALRILNMTEQVLSKPEFSSESVLPADVFQMLRITES